MTEREAFCAALANGPLLRADAVVVLSGDGTVRLDVAVGVLRQRAAHWAVVSGGLDNPPHSVHADQMAEYLVEQGLAPDRIIIERDSLNTREQAVAIAKLAAEHEWARVLVAVSPYHQFRAFLTMLAALKEEGLDEKLHVLVVPAAQVPWWGAPDGLETDRMALLADEFEKIEAYRARGHVASYAEGLAYLRFWEGHQEEQAA